MTLLSASSVAAAVSTTYPPENQSRTFADGVGGWTNSKAQQGLGGLCIEGLLCPAVTNTYQGGGGVDGPSDGFVRTSEGGLLGVGLAATSTGIWESASFIYNGAGGQQPNQLSFSLARQADVENLLGLIGASATYKVELIDATVPSGSVTVVAATPLAQAETWTTTTNSISPSLLTIGHSYKVRITTTFNTPVAVLPSGSSDFDNVQLLATKSDGSTGGPGGPGSGGTGGGKGSAGGGSGAGAALTNSRLTQLMRSNSLTGSAVLKGNRLVVRAKCPAQVGRACRVTVQGLVRKGKPATNRRLGNIPKGKSRKFVLRVKPKQRAKVKGKQRLLFKQTVKAGKAKATVYKRLKLARGVR